MTFRNRFFLLTCILYVMFPLGWTIAGTLGDAPSFQGYTGVLNTPNAAITREGSAYAWYSDQLEQNRRHLKSGDNYFFSFGLLPWLEFGARFTEEHPSYPDGGMRDLSANAKVSIPLREWHPWLPDLAFGIQDPGGGSTHFKTGYGVVSKEFGPVRLSAGFGSGPDRMDGVFGGIEFRVCSWAQLLGDYDAEEFNVGFRIMTPDDLFPIPVALGFSGKTSTDHDFGDFDFAFMLRVPLGSSHEGPPTDNRKPETGKTAAAAIVVPLEKEDSPARGNGIESASKRLRKKLVDLGFENVRVGIRSPDTWYIEYENNRYNHNELDGLGLLTGTATEMAPPGISTLTVITREVNIPMLEMTARVKDCRPFFSGEDPDPIAFANAVDIRMPGNHPEQGVRFFGTLNNPSRFRSRLTVYPGVKTYLGTEYGAFDALVSIKPEYRVDLWKGGIASARWNIPVLWTDNYDDGEVFENNRGDSEMERLMVHQAFRITPGIMAMISGGKYLRDDYGVLGETMWVSPNGIHRVSIKAGRFENDDAEKNVLIGAYRYYLNPFDLWFEGKYGQYYYGDKGFLVTAKRFFGDTAVVLYYRHIGTETGERAAGIAISLPLTPRRDMKPSLLQIRGSDRWTYEHQTTIANSGDINPINRNIAIVPNTSYSLERTMYNHDRMHPPYIRKHILRLRNAWETWGNPDEK